MFLPPEEIRDLNEIPVFVSNRIILPFVNDGKPVRVTEAKYIRMLDDISFGDRLLGVIPGVMTNRHSPHHGPLGLPYVNATGCIAELTEYNRFKDDDATIKLKGLARFRIVEYLDAQKSYPIVSFKFFEEENKSYHNKLRMEFWEKEAEKRQRVMSEACAAANKLLNKILRAMGSPEFEEPFLTPTGDPVKLSFLLPHLYQCGEDEFLHLLQSPCPIHRFESFIEWAEDYEKRVDDNIERKELLKPFLHIKNDPELG